MKTNRTLCDKYVLELCCFECLPTKKRLDTLDSSLLFSS